MPPPVLDAGEHELAKVLLAESREELTRADGKASILLAALGIGLSAILAAILAGSWTPFALRRPYETLWWVGSSLAGASLFCFCAAVYPRLKNRESQGVTYFGDVARLKPVRKLWDELKLSETDPVARTVTQLYVIAHQARNKYAFIRAGLVALGLAIALTLTAALANHWA